MIATALVVGLGQIGMGYDLDRNPHKYVQTHGRALRYHPGYTLVGGIDSDAERRSLFEARYQSPTYDDVASAMESLRPDVVAVATPTAVHADTVSAVLLSGHLSGILCEKPLSSNLKRPASW